MLAGQPVRRGVLSPALDQMSARFNPGGMHPHPDMIRPDLGLGHLADGDDFGTAGSLVNHCAHGFLGYGLWAMVKPSSENERSMR